MSQCRSTNIKIIHKKAKSSNQGLTKNGDHETLKRKLTYEVVENERFVKRKTAN